MNILDKFIEIDGADFEDLKGFYISISEKLLPNENWVLGSLDGFNDALYGGFRAFSSKERVQLIWKNSEKSKSDLGLSETKKWLESKLEIGSRFHVELIQKQLESLIAGKGQTLFEIVIEIISEHKNIKLVLR